MRLAIALAADVSVTAIIVIRFKASVLQLANDCKSRARTQPKKALSPGPIESRDA
jgi:hypothetical protein